MGLVEQVLHHGLCLARHCRHAGPTKGLYADACTCNVSCVPHARPGDTLVVDGANWMWKPQLVTREMVSKVSRSVEGKSRAVGVAGSSSSNGTRSKL
jgi:hypothetical protein